MSEFTRVLTIPVGNRLGECILWNERTQSVWWTDIQAACLHRYDYRTAELTIFPTPERVGSFAFIEGEDRLLCAFASGFALYDPASQALKWLHRPAPDLPGTRLNDGRVDRQGRFWCGSMVEDDAARDAAGEPVRGSLYCLSGHDCHRIFGDVGISNSLCFSPDGRTLYFADSPRREIQAFDFDPATGRLGAARHFASIDEGVPDGSIVDAVGCVWNAQFGGSRVVCYSPQGEILHTLKLPVSQPTCVCIGGPDLDLLFVTSASDYLSPEARAAEPEAGHVLVYRTTATGLPEDRFRL